MAQTEKDLTIQPGMQLSLIGSVTVEATPTLRVTYSPGKGRRFVVLLIGDEARDTDAPLNVDDWLVSMGWTPPESAAGPQITVDK